ncbi:MAG: phytanoyl-CoA dioxygenase family protein [Undibacterium sp.]|nr:phytanoyl-CoA dioxygenase family protein [Undibacterium sp.]
MSFIQQGYAIRENVISPNHVQLLLNELSALELNPSQGGIRRIESIIPCINELANSEMLAAFVQEYLSGSPSLVRAIYFEKSPANNWFVTWHQDRTVSVSAKFEKPGWGPWSLKAGVWHVQPPLDVLNSMVTVRIHLDPATKDNGCLKVIPCSHQHGIVKSTEVNELASRQEAIYCQVSAGGAVVMSPHIIHSSEKSRSESKRRVIHLEYSSYVLPDGIEWLP